MITYGYFHYGEVYSVLGSGDYPAPIVLEGLQYKYWKMVVGNRDPGTGDTEIGCVNGWLRSIPARSEAWMYIGSSGRAYYDNPSMTSYWTRGNMRAYPGFAI